MAALELCSTCRELFNQPHLKWQDEGKIVYNNALLLETSKTCSICAMLYPVRFPGVQTDLALEKDFDPPYDLMLRGGSDIADDSEKSDSEGSETRDIAELDMIDIGNLEITDVGESEMIDAGEPEKGDTRKLETGHGICARLFPTTGHSNMPFISLDTKYHGLAKSSIRINPTLAGHHTADPACFQQIRNWLQICTEKHRRCKPKCKAGSTPRLPTRLIAISQELRLIETKYHNLNPLEVKYCTLSHLWTKGNHMKLVQTNIEAMRQAIDPAALLPVFREAISAVQNLGINYLWIDALCIIQDDEHDWKKELLVMGDVYKNAYCNIGATAAANHERIHSQTRNRDLFIAAGLYSSRDTSKFKLAPVAVTRAGETKDFAVCFKHLNLDARLDGNVEHLMTRAWVLQERIMSPRSIYFGEQLTWECSELLATEIFPEGAPSGPDSGPWNDNQSNRLGSLLHTHEGKYREYAEGIRINEVYGTWLHLLVKYRKCQMTYKSDVFWALAGLARYYGEALNDEYVAGLWKGDMIRGLLWKTDSKETTNIDTSGEGPPSWSWASYPHPIQYPRLSGVPLQPHLPPSPESSKGCKVLASFLDSGVVLASQDPFGPVRAGFIRLSGFLRTAKQPDDLWYLQHPEARQLFWSRGYDSKGRKASDDDVLLPLVCSAREMKIPLHGLVLEPTGRNPGEYRRIGAFTLRLGWKECQQAFDIRDENRKIITII